MQFDWMTTFWHITPEQKFCQIRHWWWNINNSISFHFKLFPRKTNDIFQKIKKTTYFGAILNTFCPTLGKNEFSWKKGLCQFLDIPIVYHRAKNKKNYSAFSEKNAKLMDGQKDRQIDNGDFIGPSIGRGSNSVLNISKEPMELLVTIYFMNLSYRCC